jgi:thioredoxin reductase (NADPH)
MVVAELAFWGPVVQIREPFRGEEKMAEKVVVVGAGAAGLTAAIYAARANLSPLVIEGLQPGGQLTITTDVENFPGFTDPVAGPDLMAGMRKQAERVGARFRAGEVTKAELGKRPFAIEVSGERIEAEALIIATGASARWLGLPSEQPLYGKGVSACATCDGFFYKDKEVTVVGGGDTAIEEALFLTHFCSKVTVIHRRDELRASKILQERAEKKTKIEFAWNSVVDEILDVEKGEVTGVRVKDVKNGEKRVIECSGVFIAIGHDPNTKAFAGQLEMNDQGYIVTAKSSMKTSVEGVFAAGDCQDSVYRQAITAAGTGCMAAIDAERYLQEQG